MFQLLNGPSCPRRTNFRAGAGTSCPCRTKKGFYGNISSEEAFQGKNTVSGAILQGQLG